jgi:hypothetical protein
MYYYIAQDCMPARDATNYIVAANFRVHSFGPKQEVRVSPSWLEVRPHVC